MTAAGINLAVDMSIDHTTTLLHTRLLQAYDTGGGAGVCNGIFHCKEKLMAFHPSSRSEGRVARRIEEQTTKLPSDVFLWAAFGSMAGSLILQIMGKKEESNFVGQWAPTLLILGMYNKIVKILGSD